MQSIDWSLPAVFEVLAAAAPDRDMLVWKDTRRTYAEVAARTRNLTAFLQRHGIGARRERSELERWECGQATVALLLYNCPEYIESMLGCFRARAVPFNVNQHYRPEEVASLLDMAGAEAVVCHRSLGALVREATRARDFLLVDVDDGSRVSPLAGSTSFEDAVGKSSDTSSLPIPSPDDLYLVCTGGTTGSPKGVLWRQGDIFVAAMGGADGASRESLSAKASVGGGTWFAAPPLMHAAAQWTAFAGIHSAATLVLHDDTAPFDARTILETVARERVNFMSIVGDAFARRLIEELRETTYDLSSLQTIVVEHAAEIDSLLVLRADGVFVCAGSDRGRPVPASKGELMTRAIDCLVNVDMGDVKQPEWMIRVKEDYFQGGESFFKSPELAALLDDMDANGVERAILLTRIGKSADRAQRFATERPDRFSLGVGGHDLLRPMRTLRSLESFVRDQPVSFAVVGPSFWGDGIYPPSNAVYYPLYTKCCELDLPLCMNTGIPGPPIPGEAQHPMHLDRVCVRFPELRLCMIHGADPWWDVAIRLMLKYRNLRLMTSAWSPKRLPQTLLHYMSTRGRDRILFASDYPVLSFQRCLDEARKLDLAPEVLDAWLHGNAEAFFFKAENSA